MPEAFYNGTQQSADDVSYALAQAGYQIVGSTPGSPRAATDFWQEARQLFKTERLEQGSPRDYRVHIREPQGSNQFLQVKAGSRFRADGIGQVAMGAPATPVQNPGVSAWQDTRSGETLEVFAWDGTEIGFSDLIAFFQINGSLLNSLKPAEGTAGLQILNGVATHYDGQEVYEFSLTRQTLFALGAKGTIETVTLEQLHQSHLPTGFGADPASAFQETPFAEMLFRQGILLAPVEEGKRKPWYKRWYTWVLAALIAVIIAIFAILISSGDDPGSTETPTPVSTPTPAEEPTSDPEPSPDSGSGTQPAVPDTGGSNGGSGILPDIEWPWQEPGWEWPWQEPGWQWPWENPDWQWPWQN